MFRSNLVLSATLAALALAACGEGAAPAAGPAPAAGTPATAQATAAPTEADVKAVIERRVRSLATGSGTSHKSVDITFQAVEFGQPRALNEQDRIDGVRGETVYPVRARYSEHRTWGNGETQDLETYYEYDFYRDDFGAWDYVGKGPVR